MSFYFNVFFLFALLDVSIEEEGHFLPTTRSIEFKVAPELLTTTSPTTTITNVASVMESGEKEKVHLLGPNETVSVVIVVFAAGNEAIVKSRSEDLSRWTMSKISNLTIKGKTMTDFKFRHVNVQPLVDLNGFRMLAKGTTSTKKHL